ncbi:MAG: response regulator [Verrucomicrobiota bacterium]|nr:response regulator [Verrucomicrobiota bacterium]
MKKRVLLVDDDFAVLAGLAGVLVSEGYDVVHAADGAEALVKFRAEDDFDIVLLDLNMPKKNGWETFAEISAIHPLVPVIVITARPDQYGNAVAAGVGALMEKPLDLPILLQQMEALVHEPAQERLARRTAKNLNLSYSRAPVGNDGSVFGQVINRAKAIRRPWARSNDAAVVAPEQPLDRLLQAWRSCTREERQLFLDGMKWHGRQQAQAEPDDSSPLPNSEMADVDLLPPVTKRPEDSAITAGTANHEARR